jgi:hypothetical protein
MSQCDTYVSVAVLLVLQWWGFWLALHHVSSLHCSDHHKHKLSSVTNSSPMFVTLTVGRTGMGTVQFLHGQDETKIPGARKIIDKIYVGGELCVL